MKSPSPVCSNMQSFSSFPIQKFVCDKTNGSFPNKSCYLCFSRDGWESVSPRRSCRPSRWKAQTASSLPPPKRQHWYRCKPRQEWTQSNPSTMTFLENWAKILWQGSRLRLGVTAKVRRIWKWSNGVKVSEMGIFCCISFTNNVNSCKKFNEKAPMYRYKTKHQWRHWRLKQSLAHYTECQVGNTPDLRCQRVHGARQCDKVWLASPIFSLFIWHSLIDPDIYVLP